MFEHEKIVYTYTEKEVEVFQALYNKIMIDMDDYIDLHLKRFDALPDESGFYKYGKEYWENLWDEYYTRYLNLTQKRIAWVKKIHTKQKTYITYYFLAELYDRLGDGDKCDNDYMRQFRYFALKAFRLNRQSTRICELLADTYSCLAMLGDGNEFIADGSDFPPCQRNQIKNIELAISYIKKALNIKPENKNFKRLLKMYYNDRIQHYKPKGEVRQMHHWRVHP